MSAANPFKGRFEVFGQDAEELVEKINGNAFRELREVLAEEPGGGGQVILVRAPRAGFGKTFLLNRIAGSLRDTHHFSKVELFGGRRLEAPHVLDCLLRSLCQSVDRPDGLTELDLIARKVMAKGLEPLVHTGEVPAQDRAVALAALRTKPVETFDFHNDGAVTAHWVRANIEVLGPRVTSQLSALTGAPLKETAYWVELLFRYASTSPETADRTRLLFETIFGVDRSKASPSGSADNLLGLCALASTVCRVVFVIDETEGLSTQPEDALEIASFVTGLAQAAPKVAVVLSLNDDVWETAFVPRLPGGLEDRLTENEITLETMSRAEAEALVRLRAGKRADRIIEDMEWGEGPWHARQVLKLATAAVTGKKAPARPAPVSPPPAAETAPDPSPKSEDAVIKPAVEEPKQSQPTPVAPPVEAPAAPAPAVVAPAVVAPADEDPASLMARIQAVFGRPAAGEEATKTVFEKAAEKSPSAPSEERAPDAPAAEVKEAVAEVKETAEVKPSGLYTPPAMPEEVKKSLPKAPAEPKPEVYAKESKPEGGTPSPETPGEKPAENKEPVEGPAAKKEPAASPFSAITPPPMEPLVPAKEEPKAEEPKAEEPKAEEPKAEEAKTEAPKPESKDLAPVKQEAPPASPFSPGTTAPSRNPFQAAKNAEEKKPAATAKALQEPKSVQPAASPFSTITPPPMEPLVPAKEELKAEEPKAEEPKAEEPKAEEAKTEAPKTESKDLSPVKQEAPPASPFSPGTTAPSRNPFQAAKNAEEPKAEDLETESKDLAAVKQEAPPASPFSPGNNSSSRNPFQAAENAEEKKPAATAKELQEPKPVQPAASPFSAITPPPMEPLVPAKEEPQAEEPKAEEPKAEEPKAEEPKAEEPKAEEPKAEEPKPVQPAANPFVPVEPKAAAPSKPEAKPNPFTPVQLSPVDSTKEAKSEPAAPALAASPFREAPPEGSGAPKSPFTPAAKPADPATDPPAGTTPTQPRRTPTQLPPKRSERPRPVSSNSAPSPFAAAAGPAPQSPFKSAQPAAPAPSPFKPAEPEPKVPAADLPDRPAQASADPATQLSEENAAKVDQLLKQFKERYGRE